MLNKKPTIKDKCLIYKKNNKRLNKYDKKIKYLDLSPVDNIEAENEYIQALDWAIKNEKIHNIALSGPYGSGKSSIIQSYIKNYPTVNYLNISLGSFKENYQDNYSKENRLLNDSEVEEGILKQLFYRVDSEDIPQSRYRKLSKKRVSHLYSRFAISIFLVWFFVMLFLPEKYNTFLSIITQIENVFGCNKVTSWTVFAILYLIAVYSLTILYKNHLSKFRITEIKLPVNATVVSYQTADASVFNRNLDEIIYYFEETNYEVVFFEDLDRVENAKIFIKLRELNNLLNGNKMIKNKIKFVYAVRDDIFTSSDRTKFFEFIIPIIPIMNSTNSGEKLLTIIRDDKEISLSSTFINDISPFISDMRLLNNSYNEFLIYKNTIKTKQALTLKDEQMFSLIAFKNLFPKDFSDLQNEKGIVKQAFIDKNEFINSIKNKHQEKIAAITNELSVLQKEPLKELKELYVSFFYELGNWNSIVDYISFNGKQVSILALTSNKYDFGELIKELKLEATVLLHMNNGQNKNNKIQKNTIEEYEKRYNNLKIGLNNQIKEKKKEIEHLKNQIYIVDSFTIKELIEEYGTRELFSENVKNNKTLVYMLRMGYIDEQYANYINYFVDSSVTTSDMNYILAIKNREKLPYDYKLTRIDQIINRLQLHEFKQTEILNYDMFDKLLTSNEYADKRNNFIQALQNSEEKWLYIDSFYNRTENKKVFIESLTHEWPAFFESTLNNSVLTEEKRKLYINQILDNSYIDDVALQNNDNTVTEFFSNNRDIFGYLSKVRSSKIIEIISSLNIKFLDVDLKIADKNIIDTIINNRLYEINYQMLKEIVGLTKPELLNTFCTKIYSTLLEVNNKSVLDYIDTEWFNYVNNVVLLENNTKEKTEVVIKLLQKSISDQDIINRIINHENFKVEYFKEDLFDDYTDDQSIIDDMWNQIIDEDKVVANWDNTIAMWKWNNFSNNIIDFIERNVDVISKKQIPENEKNFINECLRTDFDDKVYKKITSKIKIDDISIQTIARNKLIILIDNRCFKMNINIYRQFISYYPDLLNFIIIKNQNDFINIMNEVQVSKDLFLKLLDDKNITEELKDKLIKQYSGKYMTESVANELLKKQYKIGKDVFFQAWPLLDEQNKKELMINYLDLLDSQDFEKCFNNIQEYEGFRKRNRHNVELKYNEYNVLLSNKLLKIGYLTSVNINTRVVTTYSGEDKKINPEKILTCIVKNIKKK